jgi:hypothetical protein
MTDVDILLTDILARRNKEREKRGGGAGNERTTSNYLKYPMEKSIYT